MKIVLERIKEKVARCGEQMAKAGLVIGTWGNISVFHPGDELVVITPSGMNYNSLKLADMVVVDLDGNVVEGERKPSIETPMHIDVYKARPDIRAIVHTHSTYACAAAVARTPVPPILEEMVQLVGGSVEVADYAQPGSEELAAKTVEALGPRNAVLLANHGVVGVARELDEALKICQVVEKAAQVYILAKTIGEPVSLCEEEIEGLCVYYRDHYGQGK